ncbi:tautomerase family protein [Bacillus cabrialesii]|uniref:Tautomerase family protein n=1 Tax=Bacillus cabrialesii subsp. tritici TaxID=2944916 RepID=A0ABT9DPM3_9BACI|nr:tautomerase family protein [Bacillus cabrialesii]AUZ27796.1 tautomerase family protein [Bacillus cereus]OLQ49130.1 tautomerase [Bacillus licheniformis]POO74164.1 tautomerase family protein [Bacillus subtilis]MDO8226642.1 tautomerase family protein [Bacillus cabrialesii subsp. tritici]MDU0156642.1 tautomerase family protein [Bacillus cabrialesii]
MPFVQIHLRAGRSEAWLQKLSRTIHQSMTEEINVPEDDYFQVIRQYENSEFFYDPSYLQVERTDELIYIHFTLKHSRTTEQKKALYRSIASGIHSELGVRKEDVFIMLAGNKDEDWSFGNGEAQMIE